MFATDEMLPQPRAVARPGAALVVDKVDTELVVRLRDDGKSWGAIRQAHPPVKSASGKRVRPSVGSIRRAYANSQGG